ncbi:MAG: cation diffusion facilitator family transporter, partial [Bacteroidota bacterium]
WYEDLEQTHRTVKELEGLVNHHFGHRVELFIHTDPCLPSSCGICTLVDCQVRKHPFVKRLDWELPMLLKNRPHSA